MGAYRDFLQRLVELLLYLGPLVLVGALEEAEQMQTGPELLGLSDAVHELLEDLRSPREIVHLEVPLVLLGHRRHLGQRGLRKRSGSL